MAADGKEVEEVEDDEEVEEVEDDDCGSDAYGDVDDDDVGGGTPCPDVGTLATVFSRLLEMASHVSPGGGGWVRSRVRERRVLGERAARVRLARDRKLFTSVIQSVL